MSENFKKILLAASLTLNLVFVGTYLVHTVPFFWGKQDSGVPRGPLFLQLDLTLEQKKGLLEERDIFHARLQELRQEASAKQLELIDLLSPFPPDMQKIGKKKSEIRQLQDAVQDRVIDHFIQAGTLLTPGQRDHFFQLIKGRMGTGTGMCLPCKRTMGPVQPREITHE